MRSLQRQAQSIVDSLFNRATKQRTSMNWVKDAKDKLDRPLPGLDVVALAKKAEAIRLLTEIEDSLREQAFAGSDDWDCIPTFDPKNRQDAELPLADLL